MIFIIMIEVFQQTLYNVKIEGVEAYDLNIN